jgi:hypothetical protein
MMKLEPIPTDFPKPCNMDAIRGDTSRELSQADRKRKKLIRVGRIGSAVEAYLKPLDARQIWHC